MLIFIVENKTSEFGLISRQKRSFQKENQGENFRLPSLLFLEGGRRRERGGVREGAGGDYTPKTAYLKNFLKFQMIRG